MGVAASTAGFWEVGRQEPSLDKLKRLAEILHVPPEELAFGRRPETTRVLPLWTQARMVGLLRDASREQTSDSAPVTPEEQRLADGVFIVEDDGMEPFFLANDIVGVKQTSTPRVGEDVVARLPSGELMFRRFGGRTDQGVVLLAINPKYAPVVGPYIEILGAYRWLRRSAPEAE